jgi:chemotaxis protein MotB
MQFTNRRPVTQESNMDAWLLSYADMITLFLCFFALLIAVSAPKEGKLEKVKKDLSAQFSGKDKTVEIKNEMVTELRSIMFLNQLQHEMIIDDIGKGIILEFKSNSFYNPGSAELKEQGEAVLQQLATTMERIENDVYTIEVEGHTDDIPIKTTQYPSNWELSTNRATNVVRFLIGQGIDPRKLKAAGYADILPKVPNRTATGKPIPENQAENRRIVIKLLRSN